MSDDFGTVSLKRGDHARELEVLRAHRESLVKMLGEVDQQIRELELSSPAPPQHPARRGFEETSEYDEPTGVTHGGGGPRLLLILGAAVLGLALIGYLIWRASSDRAAAPTETVVEETATTAPATVQESPPAAMLTIAPATRDYGLVRKGTRTTRQYEVMNNSEEPISIALSRSACRCLYYEHAPVVPPKARETITVTIDGGKAKAGTLRETVKVTSKADAATGTSFDVIATVR